ncbi:MAG: Zn-dependent hydrolase of the metallo-beta-lactamase superfamily [Candidatus Nomurabacteria bacterium GW2011_GWE1_32_28]|uniref:Zn-dependent hydrolase of the metallo-beta-lactamase superfamily n=1 Tax=Candidatus Nomurabacteria bacterium GW2011_GWF1_31_48 TaxID=1618767 RepID=A0A0G0BHY0_9BACT|nr:MAG: Zn-dependent hydrolase of the metallo-beta-lactamase superfamily [Candidatus Nomurabacteria bacterium GW2011_GWF2_30_133]KKP28889.1 MAG: Zn-dependent hydrolase of the metallo-beta-lactamase superfamily [Candidatus Nomurabacteria bacterium GW2011_GWE2_31_40]KKP30627.1 MAG: Zn-dependent hydrolase of the metallo-beta-lactamase superfamily [Candidatus Nomurabacteria bacterium GW2011_GWF1_31_48]KKP35145.1 MAG: Zn-dependent hydrolase of the metallo-beta-lactamase superfamily [Candidatus Nomura
MFLFKKEKMFFILFFVIIYLMIITYFGEQFFKIGQGEMVLAFNPVSKAAKSNISAHFGADIAFVTTNHPLYNGVEQLSHGDRMPFVINGPGDYEIKDIFVKGVMSDALVSNKNYINTIYSFTLDNIKVAFFGALSNPEISKETQESINSPDIIFIPIGGDSASKEASVLSAKSAAKFALLFDPKLIIPMSYNDETLKVFLKEIGEEKALEVDKLTLKLKDLDGKEGEVVVLKAI